MNQELLALLERMTRIYDDQVWRGFEAVPPTDLDVIDDLGALNANWN